MVSTEEVTLPVKDTYHGGLYGPYGRYSFSSCTLESRGPYRA